MAAIEEESQVREPLAPYGSPPGCPPGLEYLIQVDQLIVSQTVELLEALTSYEGANKFIVCNSVGQQVLFAAEDSGFCMRQCCRGHRSFVMHITDNNGQEVMRVARDFKCCGGCNLCACLPCCAYEIKVEAPPGNKIGTVKQTFSIWKACYDVMDASGDTVLNITGPCCMFTCPCFDIDFTVRATNGDEVGRVSKQWSGLAKEAFTQADNFGITFPMDLDVKVKGTLLGAVFLINMMYFEDKKTEEK